MPVFKHSESKILKILTLIQISKRKFDFNTNYKYIKRD